MASAGDGDVQKGAIKLSYFVGGQLPMMVDNQISAGNKAVGCSTIKPNGSGHSHLSYSSQCRKRIELIIKSVLLTTKKRLQVFLLPCSALHHDL